MLPKSYSFQTQKDNKNRKGVSKKKQGILKKEPTVSKADVLETSERIKKVNSVPRYTDEGNGLNTYNRTASQSYYEEVDDVMKPCLRILQMLKSNKNSWPFR